MARLIRKTYKDKNGKRHQSNYQVEFYDDGRSPRRKRISLGTRDKAAAEHKKLDLERQYAMGLFDPWDAGPSDKPTVAKAVKLFIKRQKRLGRAEGTVTHYEALLTRLKDSLAPKFLLIDVKCRHVEAFLEGCDIGASSTKNYVRHFRAFFHWAVKTGYIDRVPFSDDFKEEIASLQDHPLPSHYSLEQFEELCRLADEQAASPTMKRYPNPSWVADVLRGLFLLGNRPKELETLQWQDLDLASGYVLFRRTKNRQQRRVYVPERLQSYLAGMEARRLTPTEPAELVFKTAYGHPLTKDSRHNVGRRVKSFARELGFSEDIKSLYGMRHGFATHHTMNGSPAAVVAGMLGHKRLAQLDAYSHYSPQAGAKWQEEAFGGEAVDLEAENAYLKNENEQLKARVAELESELTTELM